jgi:uncharacterized protein YggT (Ycf19 family)
MPDDPKSTPGLSVAKAAVWVVHAFLLVAVVILAVAFVLELFNASTTAPFTQWVYRSAATVMAPFRGIFPAVEGIGGNGSVLDFAILFAILVYGLLDRAAEALLVWLDAKIREVRVADTLAAVDLRGAPVPQPTHGYDQGFMDAAPGQGYSTS